MQELAPPTLPRPDVAKEDTLFFTFSAPQTGHLGAAACGLSTNFSKWRPQFPHSYSYMGIPYPPSALITVAVLTNRAPGVGIP